MNYLPLFLILSIAFSSPVEQPKAMDYCAIETIKAPVKTSKYGRYVVITNGRYTSVKVTIWHDTLDGWIVVDRIRIPAHHTKTFGYDSGQSLFSYGYTIQGDHKVRRFYSDNIEIQ